ncbi:MAG: hypothetical protein J0L58_09330 [Burkholderiales bacterium]|uniref:hypothetical protein n=1 Tax=Inhella sp. TaxID=1921806 RepID=UPI001AD0CE46|nr:hypothetical protein [Burkholderiales bacterium]
MGIWIDEMEASAKRHTGASLRDRRMLRLAMEDRHASAHEAAGADCVLLMLEACVRPSQVLAPDVAEDMLHSEVARQAYPGFRLRGGQAALLMPGPPGPDEVKRLLMGMHRRLTKLAPNGVVLAFGAARALEARRGAASWLALADLRLQTREATLQLQRAVPARQDLPSDRRRRYAAERGKAA